jgi:hypothetical protein
LGEHVHPQNASAKLRGLRPARRGAREQEIMEFEFKSGLGGSKSLTL